MPANDGMRVVMVFPLGRDAELVRTALEKSHCHCETFKDIEGAIEALRFGNAGALLVAEEALGNKAVAILAEALR